MFCVFRVAKYFYETFLLTLNHCEIEILEKQCKQTLGCYSENPRRFPQKLWILLKLVKYQKAEIPHNRTCVAKSPGFSTIWKRIVILDLRKLKDTTRRKENGECLLHWRIVRGKIAFVSTRWWRKRLISRFIVSFLWHQNVLIQLIFPILPISTFAHCGNVSEYFQRGGSKKDHNLRVSLS